jgi:hypothetical protein
MISQLNQCPSGLVLDFSTLTYYSARMYYQKLLGGLDNVGGLRLSRSPTVDPEKIPSRLKKISVFGSTIPLEIEKWLESHHDILEEIAFPVSEWHWKKSSSTHSTKDSNFKFVVYVQFYCLA